MRDWYYKTIACGLVLAMVGLPGCGGGSQPEQTGSEFDPGQPGVAVIDMDRLITATGENTRIQGAMEERNQQIQIEMNQMDQSLRQQFQAERAKLGEELTDADRQRLAQLNAQFTQRMQQVYQQKQQELIGMRDQMLDAFRQEIAPDALDVARARGMTMVMILSPQVMAYAPEADITDELIAHQTVFGDGGGADSGANSGSPSPTQPPAGTMPAP